MFLLFSILLAVEQEVYPACIFIHHFEMTTPAGAESLEMSGKISLTCSACITPK